VERGLAEHTLEAYRRDLERYAATLTAAGRTEIEDVSTQDVADFLAGLREGDETHAPLAASSAGRAVVAVRGLHAFALAEGLATQDPARLVRPPAPPRRVPQDISVTDVERLLDAAEVGQSALRDRALLELLYSTGARISEAIGLDVDDLELSADSRSSSVAAVVRLNGKGGKQRLVPVGSFARDAVDAYLVRARPALAAASGRGQGSPALFLNARGGRLTRQGAWGALRAAAGRAGLAQVSPHVLRHSFATHVLQSSGDLRAVQELLGHASITATQVYTALDFQHLAHVYDQAHPRAKKRD
jgi:integrase/recombinase XerD